MATNEAKVATCESIIGYVFENKLSCLEALQTSGHVLRWQQDLIRIERNDRLAVYGDVVAKAFLCKQWLDTGRSKGGYNISLSPSAFTHS
jgi:ribonuclease-3